jgi:hypothetical protein
VPYYFKSTSPGGDEAVYGPFDLEADADSCRDEVVTDKPDHTVDAVFQEGTDYLNTLPRPYATYSMDDGSTQELWTDGTSKTIPAP